MARKIEMFEACDGSVYGSILEAEAHEQKLQDEELIEKFLESEENVYDKSAHLTVAENTLLAFSAWCRGERKTDAVVDFQKGKEEAESGAKEATDGKDSD